MKTIPNFVLPTNLYRDLTERATWRHHTISEELRIAIDTTLDPTYSYNSSHDVFYKKIIRGVYNNYRFYIVHPDYKNNKKFVKKFDFKLSTPTKETLNRLSKITNYDLWSKAFNLDIIERLGYTLVDPFYIDFIDKYKTGD